MCTTATYRNIFNYLNEQLLLVTCDNNGFLYFAPQSNFTNFKLNSSSVYSALVVKLADFSDGASGARGGLDGLA